MSAIQIAGSTSEHPWGDISYDGRLETLLESQAGNDPQLGDLSKLSGALDRLSPDAIGVPGWGFDFAQGALSWARKNDAIPILMSESKYDDAKRVWLKELVKRYRFVKRFGAALVGGTRHREYTISLGVPADRIFYGYDVIDNDYFISQTDFLRAAPGQGVSGSVSRPFFLASNRFIERKNLAFLIRAFHHYVGQESDAGSHDLVLLGDGALKQELEELVASLGLTGRVHFPGFVGYSEIPAWYAAASVFIHPAFAEQWGLVVNEAMASGLPTLVSKTCGCMPDLMREGETGYSFDPTNVEELSARMLELASCDSLRSDLGVAGRRLIEETHSPRAFGSGLLAAIDSAR